ncbi:hypothetical protein EDD85DRAFT_2926 [Armillaria nabsnona]|nr:hypothetical protein EDD85DRAFT_2926 [Armillaria nabsnona]
MLWHPYKGRKALKIRYTYVPASAMILSCSCTLCSSLRSTSMGKDWFRGERNQSLPLLGPFSSSTPIATTLRHGDLPTRRFRSRFVSPSPSRQPSLMLICAIPIQDDIVPHRTKRGFLTDGWQSEKTSMAKSVGTGMAWLDGTADGGEEGADVETTLMGVLFLFNGADQYMLE